MIIRQTPKFNQQLKSMRTLELGFVFSLALLIFVFQAWKRIDHKTRIVERIDFKIEVENVPAIKNEKSTPRPTRPSIPIESEEEEIPIDATIAPTDINLRDLPSPPSLPKIEEEESSAPFLVVDEYPQPIGGFAAIQNHLKYPEMARRAGIEGRVIIQVIIDEKGNVISTNVIKSLGNNGCDQAAIKAIRSVKWKPAMQRDKPVRVSISIPVLFTLH
ncbi:TonB family protein [candidate division KSB1 bacterium]|nr:TonB family protein [candidate division KSB1 bacterium]